MATSGFRGVRVADRVREEVSRVFARGLSDPRLDGLRVLRVDISGDLQIAWIYLGLGHLDSADQRKRALQGLKSANGRIRKLLSPGLGMRRVPELRFAFDAAAEEEAKMAALIEEANRGREVEQAAQSPLIPDNPH